MSLFEKLRHFCHTGADRLEDLHTEIVAEVLRNSQELLLHWLQHTGATSLGNPDSIEIKTQQEFPALAGQTTDSRPDMTIMLHQDDKRQLVWVESKVGAEVRPGQLQLYAEQLKAKQRLDRTALIFITRAFEPPERIQETPTFSFHQARWFEFYELLKAHVNGDGLAKELKLFMEKNNMSLHNQFRTVDLLALETFMDAKSLMDETLFTEVAEEFEAIFGKRRRGNTAMSQMAKQRYVLVVAFGKQWDWECLVGYWLPSDNPSEGIGVGVDLGGRPYTANGKKAVAAFRKFFRTRPGWDASGLENEKWCMISRRKDLRAFMSQNDQVNAIKQYLLSLLGEVKQFKEAYPRLLWAPRGGATDEES